MVVSECRPTVCYRVVTYEIIRDYFLHFISEVLAPKIPPLITASIMMMMMMIMRQVSDTPVRAYSRDRAQVTRSCGM